MGFERHLSREGPNRGRFWYFISRANVRCVNTRRRTGRMSVLLHLQFRHFCLFSSTVKRNPHHSRLRFKRVPVDDSTTSSESRITAHLIISADYFRSMDTEKRSLLECHVWLNENRNHTSNTCVSCGPKHCLTHIFKMKTEIPCRHKTCIILTINTNAHKKTHVDWSKSPQLLCVGLSVFVVGCGVCCGVCLLCTV